MLKTLIYIIDTSVLCTELEHLTSNAHLFDMFQTSTRISPTLFFVPSSLVRSFHLQLSKSKPLSRPRVMFRFLPLSLPVYCWGRGQNWHSPGTRHALLDTVRDPWPLHPGKTCWSGHDRTLMVHQRSKMHNHENCKWPSHKSVICNVSHHMMTCCEIAIRKRDIDKEKKKKKRILKMVRWGKRGHRNERVKSKKNLRQKRQRTRTRQRAAQTEQGRTG